MIPYDEFLFGTVWNPQFEGAERAGSGQEGLSQYGAIPLFAGTFLISIIALCVSVPVGLFSAIYLSEYATSKERAFFEAKVINKLQTGFSLSKIIKIFFKYGNTFCTGATLKKKYIKDFICVLK